MVQIESAVSPPVAGRELLPALPTVLCSLLLGKDLDKPGVSQSHTVLF